MSAAAARLERLATVIEGAVATGGTMRVVDDGGRALLTIEAGSARAEADLDDPSTAAAWGIGLTALARELRRCAEEDRRGDAAAPRFGAAS